MDINKLFIQIVKTRIKMHETRNLIENANLRLSINEGDQIWLTRKKKALDDLKVLESQELELYQILYSMKDGYNKKDWNEILENLGIFIAQTSGNNLVSQATNEDELNMALDCMTTALKNAYKELETAIDSDNEDLITIVNSEIAYYEFDMKKNKRGEERLKELLESLK